MKMEPHSNDNLLPGVTCDGLITMVHSNEPVVDENSVPRCFEDLVQDSLRHARMELKQKMDFIIESVNEGRE